MAGVIGQPDQYGMVPYEHDDGNTYQLPAEFFEQPGQAPPDIHGPNQEAAPWAAGLPDAPPNDSPAPDELLAPHEIPPWEVQQQAPAPPEDLGPPPAPTPGHAFGGSMSQSHSESFNPAAPVVGHFPEFPVENFGIRGAYNDSKQALFDEAQQQGELDQVNESYAREGASAAHLLHAEDERARGIQERAIAAAQADSDQAWAAIREVQPDHFWSTRTGFQKATGFLSVGIGGFLSANYGGKNAALESIDAMIDQDIRVQQQNQELDKSKAYRADRGVDKAVDTRARILEDLNVKKAGYYEGLARDREAEGMKYQSGITQSKYMQQAAELRSKGAEYMDKRAQAAFDADQAQSLAQARLDSENADRQQRSSLQSSSQSFQHHENALDRQAKAAGSAPETVPVIVVSPEGNKYQVDPDRAGTDGKRLLPGTVEKLDETLQTNGNIAAAINRFADGMQALGPSYMGAWSGARPFTTEEKEKVKSEYTALLSRVAFGQGGKALTETELKLFKDRIGDMESWLTVSPDKKLRSFMVEKGEESRRAAASLGLRDREGKPYSPENEGYFMPEWKGPKQTSPGKVATTLKEWDPASPKTGNATNQAAVADAQWAVNNFTRFTPGKQAELVVELFEKADQAATAAGDPNLPEGRATNLRETATKLQAAASKLQDSVLHGSDLSDTPPVIHHARSDSDVDAMIREGEDRTAYQRWEDAQSEGYSSPGYRAAAKRRLQTLRPGK